VKVGRPVEGTLAGINTSALSGGEVVQRVKLFLPEAEPLLTPVPCIGYRCHPPEKHHRFLDITRHRYSMVLEPAVFSTADDIGSQHNHPLVPGISLCLKHFREFGGAVIQIPANPDVWVSTTVVVKVLCISMEA